MQISIVVAVSQNSVIGIENQLPWRLSDDLKNFKKLTVHQSVLMGRKTYQSINKPLPDRNNIILTKNADFKIDSSSIFICHSVESALSQARELQKDLFIIGGEEIYKLFLPFTSTIYLTRVHARIENGDAFFPELAEGQWLEKSKELYQKNEKNEFDFEIIQLQRVDSL